MQVGSNKIGVRSESKGQSKRDCTRLFAMHSRCRKKESDMKENLFCGALSFHISSSLG